MDSHESSPIISPQQAASHDKRLSRLAPMRENLHLCMRMILSELPDESHILCVGAGTGQELIDLAQFFPQWKFTVIEPAAAMLEICIQQAETHGIISHCHFHHGYLDSLEQTQIFDAATCILVSQFIQQVEARGDLFQQIFKHLRPGAYLLSADLAGDISTSTYQQLFDIWARTMKYAEVPSTEVDNLTRDIAILPAREIESIITAAGFDSPAVFFQSLLIHAWVSRVV